MATSERNRPHFEGRVNLNIFEEGGCGNFECSGMSFKETLKGDTSVKMRVAFLRGCHSTPREVAPAAHVLPPYTGGGGCSHACRPAPHSDCGSNPLPPSLILAGNPCPRLRNPPPVSKQAASLLTTHIPMGADPRIRAPPLPASQPPSPHTLNHHIRREAPPSAKHVGIRRPLKLPR